MSVETEIETMHGTAVISSNDTCSDCGDEYGHCLRMHGKIRLCQQCIQKAYEKHDRECERTADAKYYATIMTAGG